MDGIDIFRDQGVQVALNGKLDKSANLSDVADSAAARVNIDAQQHSVNLDELATVAPDDTGKALLATGTVDAALNALLFGASGKAIAAALTPIEVRNHTKIAPMVADVTALRSSAVDPDIDPVVYVRGTGLKAKRYIWYLNNYGTAVAIDTGGIAYVKANKYAASTGAYVFSPDTHIIHAVNDFGFQGGQSLTADGSTSFDNKPIMDLLFRYLNPQGGDFNFPALRASVVYFPTNVYWFKSKPVDPPCRIEFWGDGPAWSCFARDYNEATLENGLINLRANLCAGSVLKGLAIIAVNGKTGGRGYSNVASATDHASDCILEDFETTAVNGGAWGDYGVVIDGSLKTTGAVGNRVPILTKCQLFGGPSGAILFKSCVSPEVNLTGAYAAGGASGKVVIDGVVAVNNYYGSFDFGNLAAIDIIRCETANVRAGYIVGDVLFGANAVNATINCPHIAGNVTFQGTNCTIIGRVSGTITGANVNGNRVLDPTKPAWETIFDGEISGANYELGGLSAYKKIRISGNFIMSNDGADLYLRLGSTTVDSGASDYMYQHIKGSGAGGGTSASSVATSIVLLSLFGVGNASGECIDFEVTLQNLNKALFTTVRGTVGNVLTTGVGAAGVVFGQRLEAAAHDIFRLLPSAGTFAVGSTITVEGWRG